MFRTLTVAAILSLTVSASAFAADEANANSTPPVFTASGKIERSVSRPTGLSMLYVSYAALQAYDAYSTKQALGRGAREANPLMQGVVGNTRAMVALKAGVTLATITVAERLWKTNKPAAIAVMVATNGVAAMVAARNARTLRQLR